MINGTVSPEFPLLLGHEAAGVVSAAGTRVTRVRAGDPVVLNLSPACWRCWFCERGELCARRWRGSRRARGAPWPMAHPST
ncbi:alcohol dehydrogenase catalytic domain-containing protein [Amycolatopsis methanolica]